MRVQSTAHPEGGNPFLSGCLAGDEDKCAKDLYGSSNTLAQHKRKHLAQLSKGDTGAMNTAQDGLHSHREMQYSKRFNGIALKAPQQLHQDDNGSNIERPWPKPGDLLRDDESRLSCATPPYPSGAVHEVPMSSAARAHGAQAITKFSQKSGARSECQESDPDLLHSSQKEISLRKAACMTSMRGSPSKGAATMARVSFGRQSVGETEVLYSHRDLATRKVKHGFAHDESARPRPVPGRIQQPPVPQPRSGQWTPAHV